MPQAFFGGIHPNDQKSATNKKPIETLPPPARVVIPMSLHIGAPCTPCVAVGDQVTVGQKVGDARKVNARFYRGYRAGYAGVNRGGDEGGGVPYLLSLIHI